MAPTRSRKRKSAEPESSLSVPSFPAQTKELQNATRTPTSRSPIKKGPMRITSRQKQALIDNLQLEITERARKLRAQYTIQAQGLRTRIEIRVNRIPMALRKANIGELFAKYSEAAERPISSDNPPALARRALLSSSSKNLIQEDQSSTKHSPSSMRAKRLSDDIIDKENDDLANPKKRAKAPVPPLRTTSRAKLEPNQVLSPRSANSRSLPRSPVRPVTTPGKPQLTRPISPLKPTGPIPVGGAAGFLTSMVEKAKSTRATAVRQVTASSSSTSTIGAGRGKRAPPAAAAPKAGKRRASNGSESSAVSSGTTAVTRAVATKKAPVKKVTGAIRGIGNTAAKKPLAATIATTKATAPTRVLRRRN